MNSFIEDYLQNPAQAIENARQTLSGSQNVSSVPNLPGARQVSDDFVNSGHWYDNVDEDSIYSQIASPEYRLYETIIFAPSVR